ARMHNSTAAAVRPSAVAVPFAADDLSASLRNVVRAAISRIAEEELTAFLEAATHAHVPSRRGYRNGSSRARTITTSLGPTEVKLPRGRLFSGQEWRSTMIPRYARRLREVDAALIGLYFGGVNTRKVKQAI